MADLGERLLSVYVGLSRSVSPLARLVVAVRRRRGKEHPTRWPERLGRTDVPPPTGTVVWVHAASVGESVAILPLVRRLADARISVVFTTVTVTAASFLENRLPDRVIHQFVPLDVAPAVDRFLAHWRPQLAIFVESEVWPVAIARLADRDIPLVVSNGRMSVRSERGWTRAGGFATALFGKIRLCLAQSSADAERFQKLGVPRVVDVGNIKFDAPPPTASRTAALALARSVAGRPVVLSASTHPGEESIVLDAFEDLLTRHPDLLLILAPRHPERGSELMSLVVDRRLDVCQRSAGALPVRSTSVYIADTVGELGTFYALAPIAFVGGSLVAKGGHNPIEPIRAGSAVISGPEDANFRDVYAALARENAVAIVTGSDSLAAAIERLLVDESARSAANLAASVVVARYTGALERTWTALSSLLEPLILAAELADRERRP